MAATTLDPNDRARLREFLEQRFNLDELETLAWDLGIDYNKLPHTTTVQLSRELIGYCERRSNLNCLIAKVLHQRPDADLMQLSTKLPAGSPRTKVQIVIAQDILENPNEIIADLATKLKIDLDQVELIGMARGSLRLLIGLPQDAASELVRSAVHDFVNGKYRVISITIFDSLDATSQEAWRILIHNTSRQSTPQSGIPQPVTDSSLSERLQVGFVLRVEHLTDHIQKDAFLLMRYEDALRVESDPKRQMYFEENIASLKASLHARQQEYDELVEQLKISPPLVVDGYPTDLAPRLDEISTQISKSNLRLDTLQVGITKGIQALADNVADQISSRLTAEQNAFLQQLNWTLEQSSLGEIDSDTVLQDVRRVLALVVMQPQAPGLAAEMPYLKTAQEIIDAPHVDVVHKIKVAIPLIPFFLSYEGELGLGNTLNLEALWARLRSKITRRSEQSK
jgi:hypothetical protein